MNIQFANDFKEGNNVAFIAMTGSREHMMEELVRIYNDLKNYGKPVQGIVCKFSGTSQIITPRWNGQEY